jgi:hypothetical protein
VLYPTSLTDALRRSLSSLEVVGRLVIKTRT